MRDQYNLTVLEIESIKKKRNVLKSIYYVVDVPFKNIWLVRSIIKSYVEVIFFLFLFLVSY